MRFVVMGALLDGLGGRPGAAARGEPEPARGPHRRRRGHVHWFRRIGDDPFSTATLYGCRCGQVRAGL
ncbi:hypothetical protein [Blastococcus sp. SYSU DS0539]